MNRLNEKQMLILTVATSVLLTAVFAVLTYLDYQAIHAYENPETDPAAAEMTDPEQWGENRRIYELERQIATAQAEADLIPKREQDVIVYREIVERDATILPSTEEVTQLATTISEFEGLASVAMTNVGDLSVKPAKGVAISQMPFKLKISGTFDQIVKFINLFENEDRIVNTSSVSIAAGSEQSDIGVIHEASLAFVTYIYAQDANIGKPVEIANYERRKDDPLIQKQIRQEKAAEVETYQLKHRLNRRDPLVDPRRDATEEPTAAGADEYDVQKELVDRMRFEVEILKEDVRQEQQYKQEGKYVQYAQLKQLIDEKVRKLELEVNDVSPRVTINELIDIYHDEALSPFDAIKAERNIADGPILVTREECSSFHETMADALERQQYEKVVKTKKDFESLFGAKELDPDAKDLVDDMADMSDQARLMLEFGKIEMKVSGKILRSAGSILLLGGTSMKEGDMHPTSPQPCRLVKIDRDRMIWEYGGHEIEVPYEN